ncbi:hypothetical protein M8J75_007277 [Diaphorina citri]|nr:hypothetical protein M8J75_007277 [Diaphorina citri]
MASQPLKTFNFSVCSMEVLEALPTTSGSKDKDKDYKEVEEDIVLIEHKEAEEILLIEHNLANTKMKRIFLVQSRH